MLKSKIVSSLVKVYTDEVACPDCGAKTERDYTGTMYSSTGQSSIPLHTSYTAGCYQVLVESPSVHQSLRYIVNNR